MSRLLVGILSLAACLSVGAAIPTSPETEAALMRAEGLSARHLEPLNQRALEMFRARKPPHSCLVAFDAFTSFQPSMHWCIEEQKGSFVLKFWEASSEIGSKAAPPQARTKRLSSQVAQKVRQIWFLASLNARYPPDLILGADGVDYYFGVQRYTIPDVIEVHTWTPNGDYPPKWLAELGTSIFELAKADSLEEAVLSKQLGAVQDRLNRFYPESR